MKKNIKLIIGIILSIAVFAGVYFLYSTLSENYSTDNFAETSSKQDTSNETDSKTEESEFKAPDFKALDSDGNEVNLSDYFGKPIVLNFWATWCPYCIKEMPHFQKISAERDDVLFLVVNLGESFEKAKDFIDENGYTFPTLYDTKAAASYVYNTSGLPVTYFIDKNGNIVTYAPGMLTEDSLNTGIDMITK